MAAAGCLLASTAWAAEDNDKKKSESAATTSGPWITQVRWVDDQNLVAAESQGLLFRPGKVVKTTAADPSKLESLGEQESAIWTAVPIGDGKVVASNYKGDVFVHGGGDPQKVELSARWIRALKKAPGDKDLLAGTEDGKLIVVSVADRKETKRIDAHAAAIFDIAINPAGDKIATVAGDGTIKFWSWPALEAAGSASRGKDAVWSAVFTADGTQLVTGGSDRKIRLWDVANSKFLLNISSSPDWVTSLVSIPGSTLVAGGCMNGQVVVVDYAAKLPVAKLPATASGIWSVALSPDGKQLALATRKNGISLFKTEAWSAAAKEVAERATWEKPPAPKR